MIALGKNSYFNTFYSMDMEEGNKGNKCGLFVRKDRKISPHHIEKEQMFPDNKIDYCNGGTAPFETLEIIKVIADIVRQNYYAAHFGLIYGQNTHGQEIHGTFYDPDWRNK